MKILSQHRNIDAHLVKWNESITHYNGLIDDKTVFKDKQAWQAIFFERRKLLENLHEKSPSARKERGREAYKNKIVSIISMNIFTFFFDRHFMVRVDHIKKLIQRQHCKKLDRFDDR